MSAGKGAESALIFSFVLAVFLRSYGEVHGELADLIIS